MRLKQKKLAVFNQLNSEMEPLSLEYLLQKLGEGYPERSVRRWLAEMTQDGLIEKLGQKRGTKYRVIRSASSLITNKNCFSPQSAEVIAQVKRPLYERKPVTYAEDWFESYQPNHTFYIALDKRLQLFNAGKRSNRENQAGTYAHQIFNRILIDLSYNSSRLEGNTYSLLDTEKLVITGESAEGKLDVEKVMILNHKEAIRYLIDSASSLAITMQTICTVHFLLSDGLVAPRHSGKMRDHSVRIGDSTYIPFDDAKHLEIQLNRIINKAALIKDPYEQSIFLLIHISYLQSFSDVNKRTARLSANIPLIKNNLVPLSFNDVERDDYNSAMIAIYEFQDVNPLLDVYIYSYLRTCVMYDSTVEALGVDEIRVRYRQQRRQLIREIILKKLVGQALEKYAISYSLQLVGKEDQSAFLEDLFDDLKEMDQSRIVGLGITMEQLQAWRQVYLR